MNRYFNLLFSFLVAMWYTKAVEMSLNLCFTYGVISPLFNRQKQTLSGLMFWTPYEDKIICINQNNQLRPEIVSKKMLKTNIYF